MKRCFYKCKCGIFYMALPRKCRKCGATAFIPCLIEDKRGKDVAFIVVDEANKIQSQIEEKDNDK